VVVRALVIGYWDCSFVYPKWDFKIVVSLHVLCIEKTKKKRENKKKRKENKEKK